MTCQDANLVRESDAQRLESELRNSESEERNLSQRAGTSSQSGATCGRRYVTRLRTSIYGFGQSVLFVYAAAFS